MRVIAGMAKGHRLKSLPGSDPRPTSDLVRGALFNVLREYVVDRAWLDLFAGTGAVGIEALSRGASQAVMAEDDPRCQRLIQANLELTGLAASGMVFRGRVEHALPWLARQGRRFDVIFLDPPYDHGLVQDTLERLADQPALLAPGGIIVIQHSQNEAVGRLPPGLLEAGEGRYGSTSLTYLRRVGKEEGSASPGLASSDDPTGQEKR
ncbi:MAG TPA: 16S rRNA (guanine(966)-N(2))-methyltransferase RsmD [Bacillota bacterium]